MRIFFENTKIIKEYQTLEGEITWLIQYRNMSSRYGCIEHLKNWAFEKGLKIEGDIQNDLKKISKVLFPVLSEVQ